MAQGVDRIPGHSDGRSSFPRSDIGLDQLVQQILETLRAMWRRRWIGIAVAWAAAILGAVAIMTIKAEPKKSFEIMGADVKQSGEAFEGSQKYLRWQDRDANQKFFTGEHAAFSKEAADLLLEAGIIKSVPDLSKLADTRFLK